jgi:predicted AlkP superfamily phosphohydrolase/phosphomutase
MSDHGFHARSTKYFHINTYLEREGFLHRNKSLKGRFSILTYTVGVKLVEIFPFIRNLVSEKAKSKVGIKQMTDRIDWRKTVAYADFHRGIFINKEITGTARDKVARAIVQKMRACEDPRTGKKIFKVVKRKEELFSGPYFDLLPDIVWLPDADYRINANLYPVLISRRLDAPHISGEHMAAADGIFVLTGPGVARNAHVEGAHIADLAPTILYMMDVPIPSDMDGKVLRSAFEQSFREPQYTQAGEAKEKDFAFTQKEEKKLEERLKGLGYL